MERALPTIAVLGAAGLIGQAVATDLAAAGFGVHAVARRFTAAQRAGFGDGAVEAPIAGLDAAALAHLLDARGVEIVVNCLGVLQDGPGGTTEDVHRGFVSRLLAALRALGRPALLVHLSIPGRADDDRTAFSRTKRAAERLIEASGLPYVILRPGFVVAPAAFGGSALLRALAMLPATLPAALAQRPLAAIAVGDIGRTVEAVARRWAAGEREWSAAWELVERQPGTAGAMVEGLRRRLGGPKPRLAMPAWLLRAGATAGDLVARLGWQPPVRSTALAELDRGVTGDPSGWIAATGIEPTPRGAMLAGLPATVQERWFARLYLLKAPIVAVLVLFWVASGSIALAASFDAAVAILTTAGFAPAPARAITIASSVLDIAVGLAIAWRRTCRGGLLAGILVSLFYMAGAAAITPGLWIEPLGALVKTFPAIVLMLVALATLEAR